MLSAIVWTEQKRRRALCEFAMSTDTQLDELHRKLETLAREGEWSGLADVMQERDELLSAVADDSRPKLLQLALQNNEQLLKLVRSSRQEVSDQLVGLHRSRDAIGRYMNSGDPE